LEEIDCLKPFIPNLAIKLRPMLESEQLKEIFKSAIVELLRENRSEVSALLSEIIEDIAMGKAIAEGENTKLVSRESIFKLF
jgi:hypothetical protein